MHRKLRRPPIRSGGSGASSRFSHMLPISTFQAVAPAPPVILLPPSEGKAGGGDGPPVEWDGGRFTQLGPQRKVVRDAVLRVIRRRAAAQGLLGVKGAHLDRALDEWADIGTAPTMPAGLRYSGVVWDALDIPALPAPARRRAMSRIVVPSGLWGLVAADDPIPAYRLKMSARVGDLGRLSAWWLPVLGTALAERARRGMIIDLLPQEHAAAIDPAVLRSGSLLRVEILEPGPGRRSVGHAGKSLKGHLARAIIQADARSAADVAALRVPGLRPGERGTGSVATVSFTRTPEPDGLA
jgi:cytoplasmic iron level regulating protein YaaA (DUF328/UPF0246 family)